MPEQVYVWTWLPGAETPVVAGVLTADRGIVSFTYGQSYLARRDAIALYLPELPLGRGTIFPRVGSVSGCISDAAPDAWGMRVILARLVGRDADETDLGVLTYLVEAGSDRRQIADAALNGAGAVEPNQAGLEGAVTRNFASFGFDHGNLLVCGGSPCRQRTRMCANPFIGP